MCIRDRVVIIARFITRLRLPKPDSATTGNAFLDQIGKLVHYALYVFVFLMTISGMALSLQSGLTPIVFGGSGAAPPADFLAFTSVSYTHLDVYKRQARGQRVCHLWSAAEPGTGYRRGHL